MLRHLVLVFAAVALAGCATGYTYRDGYGDYYYGQPSVDYYDYGYGAPYGSIHGYPRYWRGGLGIGYGYGYGGYRSEEHTSELQSLMRISYAVFCLKKKKTKKQTYQA